MTKPPENDASKMHAKPEPEEIQRARQDVTDAATEHARAHHAWIITGRKLQDAQDRLNALLEKPRRG